MSKETEQSYYERCEKLSGDIDRLRADLERVKRERDEWERNANEMNAHWKKELTTLRQKIDALEPCGWVNAFGYSEDASEFGDSLKDATPLYDLKGIKS